MSHLRQGTRKRTGHESTIRNVVDFAHEVRIQLQDAQVIFGSVTSTAHDETGSFSIRPWGHAESKAIRFEDVSFATTVKQMGWDRHRAIAVAQQAGIFANVRRAGK